MPPRLNLFSASRSLAIRTKTTPLVTRERAIPIAPRLTRGLADSKDLPKADPGQPKGPNEDQLPHISEEAAAIGKITGEGGPDLNQGTPVEEVVQGDKKAQDSLPKVMKDEIKANKPSGTRSFHTSARSRQLEMKETAMAQAAELPPAIPGVKFGLPELPVPRENVMKYRYHDVVEQVTNLIMQHGKKAEAQRHVALILSHLRNSNPPVPTAARPLLRGAPPPSHLPLNPILYMTLAIDSVAPLLRIRAQRGAAGGGVALQIPVPLGKRQRRRIAIQWILKAAAKRSELAAGSNAFSQKVAKELINVVEGKSTVWQRRQEIHKLGVAARANIVTNNRRR